VNVERNLDVTISNIAAAIGEPARVRMLFSLLDGRARTSTELAIVADVSPSTASVHLHRLEGQQLVKVLKQGKHRYYSLNGPEVANALEAIDVVAGGTRPTFVPNTPARLLQARTCYDHMAGKIGVLLHNRLKGLGWLAPAGNGHEDAYELTPAGVKALAALGVDLEAARTMRRRFAYACLDWSERQPHVGGAVGAALLKIALKRKWVLQDLDTRALQITRAGQRELLTHFGLQI
jgi:DNA-binding transcriptional ArsR family regulator